MKKLFLLFIITFELYSSDCSPYFNPEKFYEAPEALVELLDENFPNGLFSDKAFTQSEKKDSYFLKKDSYLEFGDYIYPIKNGFWKYKLENEKISEVSIAMVEIYRSSDIQMAENVNNDYDNFWNDFNQDAYEMKLTPEQTLFRYNDAYFTMSVFIYGTNGDSTPLKGTVVNFWLKDYTQQVNTYKECIKGKKWQLMIN